MLTHLAFTLIYSLYYHCSLDVINLRCLDRWMAIDIISKRKVFTHHALPFTFLLLQSLIITIISPFIVQLSKCNIFELLSWIIFSLDSITLQYVLDFYICPLCLLAHLFSVLNNIQFHANTVYSVTERTLAYLLMFTIVEKYCYRHLCAFLKTYNPK